MCCCYFSERAVGLYSFIFDRAPCAWKSFHSRISSSVYHVLLLLPSLLLLLLLCCCCCCCCFFRAPCAAIFVNGLPNIIVLFLTEHHVLLLFFRTNCRTVYFYFCYFSERAVELYSFICVPPAAELRCITGEGSVCQFRV